MDGVEEYIEIIDRVQADTGHRFGCRDIFDIIIHTARKAKMIDKGDDYVFVLFENELRDFVTRLQINQRGMENLCAMSV